MEADGNLVPTEQPAAEEGFAGELIRYAPRQITLDPGVTQTVRVMFRRRPGMKEGEYRSHLLFQQVPEATALSGGEAGGSGLSLQIQAIFGVSIPVLVRHGELQASGRLTDAKAVRLQDGRQGLSLKVERAGNKSLRGNLIAKLGEREVGRINNLAVYLSTPSRSVVMALATEPGESLSGKELSLHLEPHRPDESLEIAGVSLRMP